MRDGFSIKARPGEARLGVARRGKAGLGYNSGPEVKRAHFQLGMAGRGMAGHGKAGHGKATRPRVRNPPYFGRARLGRAWRGRAGLGNTTGPRTDPYFRFWQGMARPGAAGRGGAWQG